MEQNFQKAMSGELTEEEYNKQFKPQDMNFEISLNEINKQRNLLTQEKVLLFIYSIFLLFIYCRIVLNSNQFLIRFQ
jgi:hypothetical protein